MQKRWPGVLRGEPRRSGVGTGRSGYLRPVAKEADYYSAHEAARLLGLSPARVRRMLRCGQIEGERGPGAAGAVAGPWRVPASALQAHRWGRAPAGPRSTRRRGGDGDHGARCPPSRRPPPRPPTCRRGGGAVDTPSETSERLSEAVGALRAKAEGLLEALEVLEVLEVLEELDRLEARLEAAEVQEIALREAARGEKERADVLRAELDAGRPGGRGERRGRWRGRGHRTGPQRGENETRLRTPNTRTS